MWFPLIEQRRIRLIEQREGNTYTQNFTSYICVWCFGKIKDVASCVILIDRVPVKDYYNRRSLNSVSKSLLSSCLKIRTESTKGDRGRNFVKTFRERIPTTSHFQPTWQNCKKNFWLLYDTRLIEPLHSHSRVNTQSLVSWRYPRI